MDTEQTCLNDIFSPEGRLSMSLPRYEFREQQIKMSQAVEDALKNKHHLMVEADTGVGKSLAYLFPSVIWALKNKAKVVISTNTINLQEQLIDKDLPLLKKIIKEQFSAVLVKGRSNYLCLRRFNRLLEENLSMLILPEEKEELDRLKKWSDKTKDGSLSDLKKPPGQDLWNEICAEKDNCMGKECAFYEPCFFQAARKRVYKANLLIVNHHLFFSDLSLKQDNQGVLPKYDAVVIDEAHFVEEVATRHLGFEVSSYGVRYLLNKLYNPKLNKGILLYLKADKEIKLVRELHEISEEFFKDLEMKLDEAEDKIIQIEKTGELPDVLGPKLDVLYGELILLKKDAKSEDMKVEISSYIRQIDELKEKLNIFRNRLLLGHVYWIEIEGGRFKRVVLRTFPIAVGNTLHALLFNKVNAVVLTGATLSVNKSFEFFKTRLGLEDTAELRLGSSFNYKEQMKIYVPKDIPSPKQDGEYKEALAASIEKYISYTGGKAFVLFTNYKLMQDVYKKVSAGLSEKNIQSFIQGREYSRSEMLKLFKEDIDSVLFGTDSFWTGVDVVGKALSNVIITRLPFAVPDHPLSKARIKYIEENGGNPFTDYSLPQAIIKLRQGVGRLIRSKNDKGIIVILDKRILTHAYGRAFWNSLPDCPRIVE